MQSKTQSLKRESGFRCRHRPNAWRPSRIAFLDGLRGIAILLVVLFHAYSRWPDDVAFGDKYKYFPLFANGWLGVELFFLISGFVILMTLEKCGSFKEFAWRRWVRLFPAMLVCSLIIYLSAPLIPDRPEGPLSIADFLPSLTFTEPSWWHPFGLTVKALDGVFWSLVVEVKFYAIFGSIYFAAGEIAAIGSLLLLWSPNIALGVVNRFSFVNAEIGHPAFLHTLTINCNSFFGAIYFGWFAAGALCYKYYSEKDVRVLAAALLLGCLSAYTSAWTLEGRVGAELIVILFFLPLLLRPTQEILSNFVLVFVGFVSYPLYLLHQNIMIGLSNRVAHGLPWMPLWLSVLVPLIPIIAGAWIIAEYIEPCARTALNKAKKSEAKGNYSAD